MAEGLRHVVITSDDHGALLALITWFLACALILCTAMRIGVRFTTMHLPGVDDWLILVAAGFAVGGTVVISFAINSGLGKRAFFLEATNIEDIQRLTYAVTVIYVLTVGVSKLSITTSLARLVCTPTRKKSVALLSILIVCWTTAITIGVVFQCALPRPWDVFTGQCIPMPPFWLSATVVDIVIDIIMILLPAHIVSGLQLTVRNKAMVISIFSLRLILIAMSITRLIFFQRFLRGDLSFDSIPYFTLTQGHATLSVIIACGPTLKSFMDSMRTGMLSASLAKHRPGTTFSQDSYNIQLFAKDSSALNSKERGKASVQPSKASGTQHSSASRGADQQYMYVPDEQGRIVAQDFPTAAPLSAIETSRSRRPSTLLSSQPSSNSFRPRMHPPPRPPPPPEALRPDLSLFVSQMGMRCVVRSDSGSGDKRHVGSRRGNGQ